jgi:predicted metal-dependent hydrolase
MPDAPAPEMLALPSGPAPVEWRRSPRARRISLRIDPRQGRVVVTLPLRASRAAGVALLRAHAGWVAERLAALPAELRLADGALVPLHGERTPIRHLPQGRGGAWLEGGEIHVTGLSEHLPRRVRDFLRAEAHRSLGGLAEAKAALAGVRARRVTVKDTRSRWGSCSPDGVLMFSWRLVMAPRFVQDYVAAHEVAHLRHMNHGPRFWGLVSDLTTATEPAMAWLREQGPGLLRIS